MKVVIINYGLGNIKSIANSLRENQIAYIISDNPIEIQNSDLAILPGVGSFPAAMDLLNKKKLDFLSILERIAPPLFSPISSGEILWSIYLSKN